MSPYLQQGNDSWNGFVMQSWTVGIRKDTKDSGQDPRRKDFRYQQNENIKKKIIMRQQKFMAERFKFFPFFSSKLFFYLLQLCLEYLFQGLFY